jgi:hypothetical protein
MIKIFKNRSREIKGFFVGLVFAMVLSGTIVVASPVVREIAFGVRISYNGAEVPFDEDSRPFIMGGRTFLPVRAIADIVGLEVGFEDGVVLLTDGSGAVPQTPGSSQDAIDSALVGRWEFVSATDFLWFFDEDGAIEFFADGRVIAHRHSEPGRLTMLGDGRFSVFGDWTQFEYVFTYVIIGNELHITDSHNDTGIWRRR